MKIKIDFVTNSSSSSFVMIGIYLDIDKIPDQQILALYKKYVYETEDNLPDMRSSFNDYINDFIKDIDLVYEYGEERYDGNNSVVVGIPYTKMREDETLKEFRARIKYQIDKKFDIDCEPSYISECWENR